MPKSPAISLRSQWLGEKLRAARERAGYKLRDAGEYLQMDHTTLGRFERGTHKIRRSYVKDLVDFYGISDPRERDMLIQLCEDAWRKDWWDGDSSGLDMGFIDFAWLEARAKHIRSFEPMVIHGLLQTPDYAQALQDIENRKHHTRRSTIRTADVRMTRQRILHGDNPTKLSVVFGEPAVMHPVGGPKVLRAQLEHLLALVQNKNIEIRIFPSNAREVPGHFGQFTYFTMPDPYPEIAYVENLAGRTFIEDESKVERFHQTYDELRQLSLNPRQTVDLIQQATKELQ